MSADIGPEIKSGSVIHWEKQILKGNTRSESSRAELSAVSLDKITKSPETS